MKMRLSNGALIASASDGEGFVVIEDGNERPLTTDEEHLLAEEIFALRQFKESVILSLEIGNGGTAYLVDKENFFPQALNTYRANARRWHFDTDIIILCRLDGDRPVPLETWRF